MAEQAFEEDKAPAGSSLTQIPNVTLPDSCVAKLTALYRCYKPSNQLREYYMTGELDGCGDSAREFWVCGKTRMMEHDRAKVMYSEFLIEEATRAAARREERSQRRNAVLGIRQRGAEDQDGSSSIANAQNNVSSASSRAEPQIAGKADNMIASKPDADTMFQAACKRSQSHPLSFKAEYGAYLRERFQAQSEHE
ncbi:hypothetical protein FVE85_9176 [Porphyridium purpureum]|uniref:Uncharacterized protein n=1 Tax=Porphyridium purpureum TaxID=35688 RepID=A0A5J4YQD3_PORPP|nr:hypothetical protein FVE85_9176 [Porphyridium purpureum]|eukprot:POR8111..scf222_8